MVVTSRGSKSAEDGVWVLMSISSHSESLVALPWVVWGLGRA